MHGLTEESRENTIASKLVERRKNGKCPNRQLPCLYHTTSPALLPLSNDLSLLKLPIGNDKKTLVKEGESRLF